jgi:hypothetical protein
MRALTNTRSEYYPKLPGISTFQVALRRRRSIFCEIIFCEMPNRCQKIFIIHIGSAGACLIVCGQVQLQHQPPCCVFNR